MTSLRNIIFCAFAVLFSCAYSLDAQVKTGHSVIVSDKIAAPDNFSSLAALLNGRTDSQKLALADSLRDEYSFRRACRVCENILKTSSDSLIKVYAAELNEYCLNGIDYSESVGLPSVIARQRFSKQDFFLYYPLPDRSWKPFGDEWIYLPDDEQSLYFSSVPDSTGRHIVFSEISDSLTCSMPQPVFGDAEADEIFPMLSADRKSMTFSARRSDGVGGYDLYESVWNSLDSCWTFPTNLGFPYSSPANDYLLVNTDDGRYTVFASDRDCPKDSVYVYVLEYEFVPAQEKVTDATRLKIIMDLNPDSPQEDSELSSAIPENAQTQEYMRKMEEVRVLRARLDSAVTHLEQMRETYAMSDEVEQRQELTNRILELEARLPSMQDSLSKVVSEVQKIEMDFLMRGVVIDYDSLTAPSDQDRQTYTFKRHNPGPPIKSISHKNPDSNQFIPEKVGVQ